MAEKIKNQEPKPPRQHHEVIHPEMERICLKALSKRVSDRYRTAAEMADDLRVLARPGKGPHSRPRAAAGTLAGIARFLGPVRGGRPQGAAVVRRRRRRLLFR